ncbi:MAG TPA: hypothetical protein VFI09_08190 [Solirubrobacterales bacterium]|nr:hypothetical protein [Solirubrobacterales bacterium]
MSCTNPTGHGAVPIQTPERHRRSLLEAFSPGRAAVADPLAKPAPLADPQREASEADTYDRLIAAIEAGSMVALDPEAQWLVEVLLEANDHESGYGRVVAEHAALVGLLDWLDGRRS